MKNFTATRAEAGERLDRHLVKKLNGVSRQSVKSLIDAGRVKVNGKRVIIAKWEMNEGDRVEAALDGRGTKKEARRSFINVVYEDDDVVVVEKPAGAVVQAGERGGGTYVDDLRNYLKRKHKSRGANVKAVHRLDRDTSGLMVFAKSRAGEGLIEQFKRHNIERSYLAVVNGRVKGENGKIDLPIEKGDFGFGKRAAIGRNGRGLDALTLYDVKERYKDATLVILRLRSGRTHQARVHMAAIGHPIVGDKTYGGDKGLDFPRQALHSHQLNFKHPKDGRKMQFKSELPEDLYQLVDKLRDLD